MAATALPLMLIVAAIMSQFSAGVADTVGAGGLASETSRGEIIVQQGLLSGIGLRHHISMDCRPSRDHRPRFSCFRTVLPLAVCRRSHRQLPSF